MTQDIAEELLQAADQYMLEGLKRLCEAAISSALTTENLAAVHELSENFNAPQLARRCVLFSLEQFEEMVGTPFTEPFRLCALFGVPFRYCRLPCTALLQCVCCAGCCPSRRVRSVPFEFSALCALPASWLP